MFSHSAALYDLIYSQFKDYAAEAAAIAARVRAAHPHAKQLLDVGCGTGEHARLLAERHGFRVDGLDLDPALVRIARDKVPSGTFHVADMTDFDLGRSYDAVLCLFSSIGYLRTLDNVRRALASFRRHLAPGGVAIVEPWFTPEVIMPNHVHIATAESEAVTVCRMGHTEVEGRISRLRLDYLIGRAEGIEHVGETHELGLFTVEEMLASFHAAGFTVEHDPEGLIGRGLYVARAG
jgi:ubiquinone/menaquinone biosynthesis C-methylase UbiE